MDKLGIKSVVYKKFRPFTLKKVESKENIMNRDFSTTNITYIYMIKDDWCYFSSVIHLNRRKIVGC